MSRKNEIEEKIKGALAGFLKVDSLSIKGNSLLREDLGLDSMDTVDLVFQLEDNFNLQISDDEIMGFKTLDDIVRYIGDKVSVARDTTK